MAEQAPDCSPLSCLSGGSLSSLLVFFADCYYINAARNFATSSGTFLATSTPEIEFCRETLMNVLFINPRFPETFWSFDRVLEFLPAKVHMPPLGLLTVAAMLPRTWGIRLADMNLSPLNDEDLNWADLAFIGGMAIQAKTMGEAIRRCREAKIRICGGGIVYATHRDDLGSVDHLFLGEVEETLPEFLDDLAAGHPKAVYRAERFPELSLTPVPRWDLIDMSNYLTMPLQVTRGCPHDCDFCHVTILNGRKPRSKSVAQVLAELDRLYQANWRGLVMFADDNFVGRKKLAGQVLAAIVQWQVRHAYPFIFSGQASVDVAADPELLRLLQQAGFVQLFLGIETTAAASLSECNKRQNIGCDPLEVVRALQEHSIEALGGFIVGFDADPPSVFDDLSAFIEQAALPTAMVGVLGALPGTALYRRMAAENRILGQTDGDSIANLSGMNVVPAMGWDRLLTGYTKLLARLYEPAPYYRRVMRYLGRYKVNPWLPKRLPTGAEVRIFLRIVWALGIKDSERRSFWLFLTRLLLQTPKLLPVGMAVIVPGHHFRVLSRRFMADPGLKK